MSGELGKCAWQAAPELRCTKYVSDVVALVEIVSPGNKNSQTGLDAFVRKAREMLAAGVHLSLVDLFPPSPRDPSPWHKTDASDGMRRPAVMALAASGSGRSRDR